MKQFSSHSHRFYERGEISKIIIILVVVVIILGIGIYGAIKFISTKKATTNQPITKEEQVPQPPKPVYDTTIGNTRFIVLSAVDIGNTIKANTSYGADLTTTERFIRVVIGAQNKGKNNLNQGSWEIGNIIDSEGRNFINIDDKAYYQLPKPNLCGTLLKPEFDPVPCVHYYEVSKKSKGLKVVIKTTEPKKEESTLNINITP